MRIVQFLSGPSPWGEVTPETMNSTGLGGRETALIQLGEKWADEGHEVINFVPVTEPYGENCQYVNYKMIGDYLGWLGADVCVSWEEPRLFGGEFAKKVKFRAIEMQVAHLNSASEESEENTDAYVVLSPWAGSFLTQQNPLIDPKKIVVRPNGVDLSRYPEQEFNYPKKVAADGSWKFFYSSSPDRGLGHLINIWPRVRDRFPSASLKIAYGIENWVDETRWTHNMQSETALDIQEGISLDGIEYLGKIGQKELARIQSDSHALLYPCDTMSPTETGCITVVEAGASYSPAIITDCDCLGSEFAEYAAISPLPFDADGFVDTISSVLNDKDQYIQLQKRGRELAKSRNWSLIAADWLDLFEENLN